MAESLLLNGDEPYRLLEDFCEKGSNTLISRHPGDRARLDLLGQRAQCPIDVIVTVVFAGSNAADAADTADAFTGDAARFAADSELAVTFEQLAVELADAGCQQPVVQPVRLAVAEHEQPVFFEPVADSVFAAAVFDQPADSGCNLA